MWQAPHPRGRGGGGSEAETKFVHLKQGQNRVPGCASKVSTAMRDTMEAEHWAPELRECCQPPGALPSDLRLHCLLVALPGVQGHVNAPLHACGMTTSTCPCRPQMSDLFHKISLFPEEMFLMCVGGGGGGAGRLRH